MSDQHMDKDALQDSPAADAQADRLTTRAGETSDDADARIEAVVGPERQEAP